MSKDKEIIPKLILEQYVLNELSLEENERVQKALIDNDELEKEIEEIKKSTIKLHKKYDSNKIIREIELKAHTENVINEIENRDKKELRFWNRFFPAPVAMGILSLMLLITFIPINMDPPEESIRIKGIKPHLNIYRRIKDSVEILNEKSIVKEGDNIQLAYVSAGKKYGFIFSVDGRGTVTYHFPVDSYKEAAVLNIEGEGEQLLPLSYELDDAPSFEHFYFITSDNIKNVKEALNYVEYLKDNSAINWNKKVPGDVEKFSFLLRKKSN